MPVTRTLYLAALLFSLAILLLVHHWMIHEHDLSGTDRWFQLSDVQNHEAWIVVFVVSGCLVYTAPWWFGCSLPQPAPHVVRLLN